MILDAASALRDGIEDRVFDVCVCGTGPAGMALALRLASKGRSVALMEGGGIEPSAQSQAIYEGENVGLPYFPLASSRIRAFGGTSRVWAGQCPPMDAADFRAKPHNPLAAWPIARADLDPYAAEATAFLACRAYGTLTDPLGFDGEEGLRRVQVPLSLPPINVGVQYRAAVERDPNLYLCYHASLVDLALDAGGSQVDRAQFATLDGQRRFAIRARHYALCLGGIENARFLLNCNRQIGPGIGNERDQVGRYFCEHPQFAAGLLLANRARLPYYGGVPCYVASERLTLEAGTTAFAIYLPPNDEPDETFPEWAVREVACSTNFTRQLAAAVLGHAPDCLDAAPPKLQPLFVVAEQALNPESRVTLGEARDQFGQRQARLDWRLTELDWHTQRVAATRIGKCYAAADYGRVRIAPWLLEKPVAMPGPDRDSVGGRHHMCTTRMSDNPATGVVDRSCRVFGVANLFIGGSSVFGSPGWANPTFTIVQLALRLADHLAGLGRA